MTKLKVIVRSEANWMGGGYHWVAVFPAKEAKPGWLSYVAFDINKGTLKVGTPNEMTLSWFYDGTKYASKTTLDSYGVYDALKEHFEKEGIELVFGSRIGRREYKW